MKRSVSRLLLVITLALVFLAMPLQSALATEGRSGSVSLTTLGSRVHPELRHPGQQRDSEASRITGWYLNEVGTSALATGQYPRGTALERAATSTASGRQRHRARLRDALQREPDPTIGAQFTNNTGATVTSLDIAYIGEMWRAGSPKPQDERPIGSTSSSARTRRASRPAPGPTTTASTSRARCDRDRRSAGRERGHREPTVFSITGLTHPQRRDVLDPLDGPGSRARARTTALRSTTSR